MVERFYMGKYDFDSVTDRSGTYSLKWDVKDGELPMWVADMDFKSAPEITEAIINRARHGVFGYSIIPDEWARAYTNWWERRYDFKMDEKSLIYCTGVIPAISSMVRKLTTPAEKVIIITPTYNIFFNSVKNNGRVPVECPLVENKKGDEVSFEIDFDALTRACEDPQAAMLLFCNPQNPTGTIWDKEVLKRVGEICHENGVIVISDEIHCDLVTDGLSYTPFASVNDINRQISITCIAPSKTFNLAGLCSAAVYTENRKLYYKVRRALNTDEVAEPGAFAMVSTIAAYEKGEEWLNELLLYIGENKRMVRDFINSSDMGIIDRSGKATYLCWLDARSLYVHNKEVPPFHKFLRDETGLWITEGKAYGISGKGFLRMNVAAPRELVNDGLLRLKRGADLYRERYDI